MWIKIFGITREGQSSSPYKITFRLVLGFKIQSLAQTVKKCPNTEFFLDRIFSYSDWIRVMQWLEGYNNSTHFVYWRNKLILVTLERTSTRSSRSEVFLKISQNLQENTCASVSFLNKVAGLRPMIFMKKEALAQVFSCEFWEIFKNTYLYRTPLVAASKVGLTDYVKKKHALKMILL